jgi:hypothetical protein
LTFIAVTTLFALPLLLLVWVLRMRQRRDERLGDARFDNQRIMIGRLGRLQGLFSGIAIGSILAAVISLLLILGLPGTGDTARSIVVGSPAALAPPEGKSTITGYVDLAETAQFNENLLLVKRTLYFAPVRASAGERAPIKYFVEVRRDDLRNKNFHEIEFPKDKDKVHAWRFRVRDIQFTPYLSGVLRKDGLPGEIVNLYRYAGYEVSEPNYVLFRSRGRLTWRYFVIAAQFAISAIVASLVGLLFARRRKALARKSSDELDEE